MKKLSIQNFTIIIDTREQRPYTFQNIQPEPPETITQGLTTGDYSLAGLKDRICIERKELSDLFNSIGTGRKRFEREMIRMKDFEYSALVIESSLSGIFTNPPSRSKMNPKAVFRTIISWSVKYNICVFPMWNRDAAERVTYLILKRYYDDWIKNNI